MLIGILRPTVAADTGVLPVGQPEYDFHYELGVRVQATDPRKLDYQIGPYRIDQFRMAGKPFTGLRYLQGSKITVFGFAAEDFRSVKDARAEAYESLRGGFAAVPYQNTFVYASFTLDEALAKDPDYNGKVWRGLAGDVDQAFVVYQKSKFTLLAGRFAGFWGPQKSLIFGKHQKLDGLAYTMRFGRIVVSYRLAQLNGFNPDVVDTVGLFQNRYIAAHRVDVHLRDNLCIGGFEAVLFGGAGRTIDAFYLNPLLFLHGTQLNKGTNDNTVIGFDFSWQPWRNYSLYGQVLIDDLQIDSETAADKEPAEYGVIGGIYAANVLPHIDLKAEYTRVTNWTFNQMLPRNRYLNDGKPIGDVRGNDYDLAQLWVYYWFWPRHLRCNLSASYYRQGEGRITADWTSPWSDAEGDYDEPFPTGIVEKTMTFSAGVRGFVGEHGFVDIEAGLDRVTNRFHIEGEDKTLPFVKLTMSAFIFSPLDVR